MIRSRANGEQTEVARALYNPWIKIEEVFTEAFPTRYKWFTVLYMRRELNLGWRKIGRHVGFSHVHCKRVFARACQDVEALQEKILEGVTFPRIADVDDEDE